jgi:uncharacterized protein
MTEEKKKGFALLSPEKMREIASLGGSSAPAEKRSFSLDPELARRCGRAGGLAVPKENRSFSKNRELVSEAAKKGRKMEKEKKEQEGTSQ